MGGKLATASTTLSVQECGQTFQTAVAKSRGIRSHMGGMVAKMAGNDGSGFFTPTDNGAFSALDTDKPTFMVGCNIPKFTNSSQGNAATIHMYVWDRGDRRELQFYSPHGMMGGGGAAKLVRKMVSSFQREDPSLSITSAP